MNSQTGFRSSHRSTSSRILYGNERRTVPATVDLREQQMFNGVVLRTIGRIMHNEDVHTQSIGEFHQVLLDDAMGAGIGASAIAQDDNGMGIGILVLKMRLPYPLDIIADKLGRVVVYSKGHVSGICCDIIDAVGNNLPISKGLEVMVEGLGLSNTEGFALPMEVADEFLLLGVNADDGDTEFCAHFPNLSDMQELRITFLGIPHWKILEESALAKTEGLKYLSRFLSTSFNFL